MADIPFSQLPTAISVSESAYAIIIDPSLPVESQNQIISLSLLTQPVSSNFGSLTNAPALSLDTQIIVVDSGIGYTTTVGALATEISSLIGSGQPLTPTITLDPIADQAAGSSFSGTGTFSNYNVSPYPFLYVALNDQTLGSVTDSFGIFAPVGSLTSASTFEYSVGEIGDVGEQVASVFDFLGNSTSITFSTF